MEQTTSANHIPSLLPPGKKWQLIWHDEFDGDTLDRSKWDFRLHLMQQRYPTFTEECASLDGHGNLLLSLIEKDGQFYTSQLQTGSNYLDRGGAKFGKFTWPVAKIVQPKFMHKYGYYEIRCRLKTQLGWWAAFWLQSPIIGSSLDPSKAGVEVNIMENFTHNGVMSHSNNWNGYSDDMQGVNSGDRQLAETPDGYHVFGLDWSPSGYIFYIDGHESWRVDLPVSDIEQFILISTECFGYRDGDQPSPLLREAILPDAFIVDYVRVFDEIKS